MLQCSHCRSSVGFVANNQQHILKYKVGVFPKSENNTVEACDHLVAELLNDAASLAEYRFIICDEEPRVLVCIMNSEAWVSISSEQTKTRANMAKVMFSTTSLEAAGCDMRWFPRKLVDELIARLKLFCVPGVQINGFNIGYM
jgi:hypothetical protein